MNEVKHLDQFCIYDIDFNEKKLSINRTLVYTQQNGIIFKQPKTKSSKRQIYLSNNVINALKKQRETQNKYKRILGENYQDNNLVICTIDGKPKDPNNLLREFSRLIKKANVPKIRFHDLRHTFATLMLENGESPKVVSEILGHSRVAVTLDIYTHVNPELQQKAAQKIDRIIF